MEVIDAPTEAFLEALADDLATQLAPGGGVGWLNVVRDGDATTLVARIVIGHDATEARGTGDSVIAAYARLRESAAEAALMLSARQLILAKLPVG